MATHYEVLGISDTATGDDVRRAYRRLVKATHPDRSGNPARFELVAQAYRALSDPALRAAYDRSLRPPGPPVAPVPQVPPSNRPRRYGRYALASVAALVVAGAAYLAAATMGQSVGDGCLVGTWRGESFEVPFRGLLDGREVAVTIRGGAGAEVSVSEDGTVRTDYAPSGPLTGSSGAHRVEGSYTGSTVERWDAAAGVVNQSRTASAGLAFRATINGRAPDHPSAVSVLGGEFPYTCTATTLAIGPYRYTRA